MSNNQGKKKKSAMGTESAGDGAWCNGFCCQHGLGRLAVPASHTLAPAPAPVRGQAQGGVKEKGLVTPQNNQFGGIFQGKR